jgi:hypothetical protein
MTFLNKLLRGFSIVSSLITGIEPVFGPKQGEAKKDYVLTILTAVIGMTEAVSQKDIVDEAKFREGVAKVIEGTVQCLNASIWRKA